MALRPPKIIKPDVISFCRSVVADLNPQPLYVPVQPVLGAAPDNCFEEVPKHIANHGGSQQFGWSIWEWPKVYIEAEFHAVWVTPNGEFLDITPKKIEVPRILFLRDPRRTYKGCQVDNVRKPGRDPDAKRYCQLAHLIYLELNKGELAYQSRVPVSPAAQRYMDERRRVSETLRRRYGDPVPEPMDGAINANQRSQRFHQTP